MHLPEPPVEWVQDGGIVDLRRRSRALMLALLALLMALLCAGAAVAAPEPSCPVSRDAQEMAARISKVLLSEVAVSNDRKVLILAGKVVDEILPPECRPGNAGTKEGGR